MGLFRKRQLVSIGDKYAIRYKELFCETKYLDLRTKGYKWSKYDEYYSHCLGTKEECLSRINFEEEIVIMEI